MPKGDPKNPITRDELFNKFRDCAKRTLTREKIEEIIVSIMDFEKLADIKELMGEITYASNGYKSKPYMPRC